MQKTLLVFPLWALLGALAGWIWPESLAALKSWIVPLLMLVMFSMGLTLSLVDFQRAWGYRKIAFWGVMLQFSLMPLLAFLLAKFLNLPPEWLIGLVLVGTTAGGTASNVMAYLARGDLALSVSMTLFSTLLAVILMPWLTWVYLQNTIQVPAASMLWMLLKIVLLPVFAGMLVRHLAAARLQRLESLLPQVAVLAIALIIGIVVALNQSNFVSLSALLVAAVVLHNLGGLVMGYLLSRGLGYDSRVSRTVAIEVAMQNSGLSVALAIKYFGAASALPGALFSVWHNISGSLFAAYWQNRHNRD